jgi:hypothetical protein
MFHIHNWFFLYMEPVVDVAHVRRPDKIYSEELPAYE